HHAVQHVPEPAPSMSGHGDQIGAEHVGLEENLLGRVAEADNRFDGHTIEQGLGRLEERTTLGFDPLHFLIRVHHDSTVVGHAFSGNGGHVKQPDCCTTAPGNVCHDWQYAAALIAPIER